MSERKLNIKRFISDLGGAKGTSELTGYSRAAPYRWLSTGSFNVRVLERIKDARPDLDLDVYFEEVQA